MGVGVSEIYGRYVELEATATYPILTLPNRNETSLLTGQRFFVERLDRQRHIPELLLSGLLLSNNEQTESSLARIAIQLNSQDVTETFNLIYILENCIDHFTFPTPKSLGTMGGQLIHLLGDLEIVGPVELLPNPRE